MVKVLTIANNKGGVGKTTSVCNIGDALARRGYRVLLIDLDPQGNLTHIYLSEEAITYTIYETLIGERTALPIHKVRSNIDVIPSSVEITRLDVALYNHPRREFVLREALYQVLVKYDYIILDTPPSLAVVNVNALTASQYVYIPLVCEGIPMEGLQLIGDLVDATQEIGGPPITGIFFNRYNHRRLNSEVVEAITKNYQGKVLPTMIGENIAVAEAPLAGKSIFEYAPDSRGAHDYELLTDDILRTINK